MYRIRTQGLRRRIVLGAGLSLGSVACSNERAANRDEQDRQNAARGTDSGARGGAAGDFGRGRDAGGTTVQGDARARGGIRTDNPEDGTGNRNRARQNRNRTGRERRNR